MRKYWPDFSTLSILARSSSGTRLRVSSSSFVLRTKNADDSCLGSVFGVSGFGVEAVPLGFASVEMDFSAAAWAAGAVAEPVDDG